MDNSSNSNLNSNTKPTQNQSNFPNSVVISKETIKRLANDVKQIMKNPLTDQGIYYNHSEDDMLKGYAMIIGPSDTPYEYGYYLFQFDFLHNYPFSPPTVTYCTNDGVNRFNPNLYKNGKVCVSILNTWRGEQWSGCQTISSVLLTLCTLLCKNPLLNEPGVHENHPDINDYNEIITYKNIEVAISGIITRKYLPSQFEMFYSTMVDLFLKNYDIITKKIETKKETTIVKLNGYTSSHYGMKVYVDYGVSLNYLNEAIQYIAN
jgi:ubiquitin-protein ligase